MHGWDIRMIERVARAKVRAFLRTHAGRRIGIQDEDDLTQELLARFLAQDGRALAPYDPKRGTRPGFIALKSDFWLRDIAKKEANRDGIVPIEPLRDRDPEDPRSAVEDAAVLRDAWGKILQCVRRKLSNHDDRDLAADLLLGLTPDEALVEALDLDQNQIYRKRSRFKQLARDCFEALFRKAGE